MLYSKQKGSGNSWFPENLTWPTTTEGQWEHPLIIDLQPCGLEPPKPKFTLNQESLFLPVSKMGFIILRGFLYRLQLLLENSGCRVYVFKNTISLFWRHHQALRFEVINKSHSSPKGHVWLNVRPSLPQLPLKIGMSSLHKKMYPLPTTELAYI